MIGDYQSTPALPDDEGKALLEELNSLCWAISFDQNGKLHRKNTNIRRPVAELEKALIEAGLRFESHVQFNEWICPQRAF